MQKIRILEIGASSLLDFDFNKDFSVDEKIEWHKLYNNNLPQFYTSVNKLSLVKKVENTFKRLIFNKNVFIFSTGNKGPRKKFHEYYPDEVMDIFDANLKIIFELLPTLIMEKQFSLTPIKFIFMGSVAGDDGATYENHAHYSCMKAALKSLVTNLKEEYKNQKNLEFIYLTIPRLSSRMTDETADSPEGFRKEFMDLISRS